MSSEKNIHFKELNDSEKNSKLYNLANGRNSAGTVTVWEKGQSKKLKLTVDSFIRARTEVTVHENVPDDMVGKTLLATFELNGIYFFGTVKLIQRDKYPVALEFNGVLYKSERRKNFRLLTFPHHQVFVSLHVGKENIEKSNVLNISTGQSQTSLFRNFLSMIGEKSDITEDLDGYLRFRVIDISVTGLAFQFGNLEAEFFKDLPIEYGEVFLDFNNKFIKIPKAKILYVIDKFSTTTKNVSLFVAGVQFMDIDTNLDIELGKLINQTLRNVESEFEDFIK